MLQKSARNGQRHRKCFIQIVSQKNKKERKLFLFVLTFALYTFVLHADWWFQKLINSSPTTTKMFFDGHYKMMIRTNFVCSDGKPFSFRQKMLNLYTTETSSNVTCEYWMNKILLSHKFIYVVQCYFQLI